jgi:Bifunctional DNA primase/polymerase, N-terminal
MTTTSRISGDGIWEAGLELASQNHPVLPVAYGCKRPCTRHGLRDASTDPGTIALWSLLYPVSNLGLRTDGLYVVDLDGEAGFESLERVEHRLGRLPRTRTQKSRSFHEHRLYGLPDDVELSSSTTPLANPAGLDVRTGRGSYVVVDPSLHPTGSRYEMDEYPIMDLPLEWVAVLRKRAEPRQRHEVRAQDLLFGEDTPYGQAALADEARKVATALPGRRHWQLNTSAFRLGQLIPHKLKVETVATQLPQVAVLAHEFELKECSRIVNAGLAVGMRYPRGPR